MSNFKYQFMHDYKAVVAVIIFLLVPVILVGKVVKIHQNEWSVMASENRLQAARIETLNGVEEQLKQKEARVQELDLKLRAATASPKAQKLTPAEAREMISLTFPPELRKRFEQISMQCENGTLETNRTHTNTDGSKDVGMSQINSRWHEARVEKMFGLDFEVAMSMPILNYIYAAFMVDHAQNFEAWVCDRIIKP